MFAGLDALGPGMLVVRHPSITAIIEPITAASATAAFAGFLDYPTLGTPVADA